MSCSCIDLSLNKTSLRRGDMRVIVNPNKKGWMEGKQKDKRQRHVIISPFLMTGLSLCEGHLSRGCPDSLLALSLFWMNMGSDYKLNQENNSLKSFSPSPTPLSRWRRRWQTKLIKICSIIVTVNNHSLCWFYLSILSPHPRLRALGQKASLLWCSFIL